MKEDNKTILMHLKQDLIAADDVTKEWTSKRERWIHEAYGNLYGNEVEGKSKIVSKEIYKQLNWLIPNYADAFLSSNDIVKCHPITYEDVASAEQNELLLNTQFCRQFPRYNFINKALRVLAVEGTLIVQTGWEVEEETVTERFEVVGSDIFGNPTSHIEEREVTKLIKNRPTAVVCRNEDVFIDPTCMDDMDKCQFAIHRFESTLSDLKSDGRYKNLDEIKRMDVYDDTDYEPQDETEFTFEDSPRKKLVVYEYWGNYDVNGDGIAEAIVCCWVGDTIIRMGENPYPDKKPPFLVVPFNSVPFELFGDSLTEVIGDNQKVKTAITRGIIDNMANSNNGQIGVHKSALDKINRDKMFKGENFEYNGTSADIWQGSYNNIPTSAFNMLELMNNEIEAQTGVKSFSGGLNTSALGSGTAVAARGVMDASSLRQVHMIRNISENLIKPLLRKWMSYNAEFLEEEEVVRHTNGEFIPIRRDNLDGSIDIDIEISTAEDNNAKTQQLSFLLQTLGSSLPFEMTKSILQEIASLGRMPFLEKQIKDHQPEPDPTQALEMQKLQAEIENLKANAQARVASAQEDDMDRALKQAKAEVEKAKARNLNSKTDVTDLEFIKTESGRDEQLKVNEQQAQFQTKQLEKVYEYESKKKLLELQEYYKELAKEKERIHDLEIMQLQSLLGGVNEQIGVPR